MTPVELVEKQTMTTRFYRGLDETSVSVAGIAFRHSGGTSACILNPNDSNISLPVGASSEVGKELVLYHCFVGLFASRMYRCLKETWGVCRIHFSSSPNGSEASDQFGNLLAESTRNGTTGRVYIEHFGPQIFPEDLLVEKYRNEMIEDLFVTCPVKLTPDPRTYLVNTPECYHPEIIPVKDVLIGSYLNLIRSRKGLITQ